MDYSKTVNLPTTDFPMKANLSRREPEMLKIWEGEKIYEKLLKSREGKNIYILHDGPPYANGNIHLGHALNKILKDLIVKHKTMLGFKAPYVPGWDCHGLPIELQVTREFGDKAKTMPVIDIRKKCRDYAGKYIKIQMEEFKRLGIFGDYEKPYLTMSPEYEAKILETFGLLFREGYIYRGKKPIYWCPTCVTALAEAEVEYGDHSSPSIYVKYRVDPDTAPEGVDREKTSVVIWTTTPWTLPANLGVCFHPQFPYSAYEFGGEYYIMADGLVDQMIQICGLKKGKAVPLNRQQIERLKVYHPFIDRESKVLFGDLVTLEQGTGIVHIAPGHGQEDYQIGLEHGMDPYSPVDDEGRFTGDFPEMKGVNVFDANPKIIELLKKKNILIFTSDISHSYPHCWRCKEPLIFRATEQWFFSVDHRELRKTALKAVDETQWIPSWGEMRFRGMVESRPDWCLSRQRAWGVPIPSFRCRKCSKNLMTAESILHFAKISMEKSIDAWYTEDIKNLVPAGTKCPDCGGEEFEREADILDVWFDSGVSHFVVLDSWKDHHWPSDLYLEGSDQHRGWFQSSLWPAIALRQRAPYRTVLTHGFVLDEAGKAMSKSLGNVIPPSDLIEKYGADILRLWVSSEDYRNDLKIGFDMMNQIADSYRKVRNTFKFIIGNLSDFTVKESVPYEELPDIDKWILHKLHQLSRQTIESYEKFEFHLVYRRILNFCAVELSSIYFDISKDILYVEGKNSRKRRSNQTVLREVYEALVRLIAPVLVFTAEEIWKFGGHEGSVHAQEYYRLNEIFDNPEIEKTMESVVNIKKDVLKSLEIKRKEKVIGNPLEADLAVFARSQEDRNLLAGMGEELRRFFQVSNVALLDGKEEGMEEYENSFVKVGKAKGNKCVRCWNYSAGLGKDADHPELCPRCTDIVKEITAS